MALQNTGEMSLDTVVSFYSLSTGEVDAESFYRSDTGVVRKTYSQINNTNQTANPTPINNQVPESGEFSFENLYGAVRVRNTSSTFPGNPTPPNPPTPGNPNPKNPSNNNPYDGGTNTNQGYNVDPFVRPGNPTPPNPSSPGNPTPPNPTVNVSHEELF
jgi:hypothetical protein